MNNEEEEVVNLLHGAFNWLHSDSEDSRRGHTYWLELRRHLPLLIAEDLLHLLPFVLEDLLRTHTGDRIESEDAEYVIMKLGCASPTQLKRHPILFDKITSHCFDIFDGRQSNAVLQWLLVAEKWGDFVTYQVEIEQAISYWRDRVESLPVEKKQRPNKISRKRRK